MSAVSVECDLQNQTANGIESHYLSYSCKRLAEYISRNFAEQREHRYWVIIVFIVSASLALINEADFYAEGKVPVLINSDLYVNLGVRKLWG